MRMMSTVPASIVYPRTLDAEVEVARFTPDELWLDVTLDSAAGRGEDPEPDRAQ